MVNIKKISRLANVSITTVSRVINHHPHVSEATREKVLKIMSELDYVPNANAICLKKGATRRIGITVTDFSMSLLVRFVHAFTVVAEKHGFTITLFITNGVSEQELVALEMLKRHQLDALVCVLRTNDWKVIESYTKYGPIMTLQRVHSDCIPSVFMDQYPAYWAGLQHLYSRGYRNILNVYPFYNSLNTQARRRAYSDFVAKYDILKTPFPNFENKISVADGEEIAQWWIEQQNKPDAIFCANDEVAAGIITTLQRAGFYVPGDLGVIGFDNTIIAHLLDLTTIDYPVEQQAENAFILVKNRLHDENKPLHLLEYKFTERKST